MTKTVQALNAEATAHQRAGRLDAAIAGYRRALDVSPLAPELHFNLGTALQTQGRIDEAIAAYRRAIAIDRTLAVAHHNLANTLRLKGDYDGAIAHYREAIAVRPDALPAHVDLAQTLQSLGDAHGAIASYEVALRLAPRDARLHDALAGALDDAARRDDALVAYRRALELADEPPIRANFARCLARASRLAPDPALLALLARALREAWARPNDLSRVASAAVTQFAPDDPLVQPLLLALLTHGRICEVSLERSLTAMRGTLLASAEGHAPPDPTSMQCALAHQCSANEHVFGVEDDEAARAAGLRARLQHAIEHRSPVAAAWIVAVAAYEPLANVPGIEALLDEAMPEPVRRLLVQWAAEPLAERRERESVRALTAVDDPVSRSVRAQYEANPYPRWSSAPRPLRTWALGAYLRTLFPLATFTRMPPDAPETLVAGCGTGQESIEFASLFARARVTAVDLSRASLAYAQRKTREAGLRNIEYAQADLLALPSTGRTFDAISAVGVLHHLADPATGLKGLASMLREHGVMRLGFYSEAGRSDVVAARRFIAQHGFDASPQGIRRCRAALLAQDGEFAPLFARMGFYSMSECRDLLFHVQEHRLTLPAIGALLEANGLRLLGFLLEPSMLAHYTRRFPDDPARTSLVHWGTLEAEHPALFAGMYRFWVQKR